jgi:hypothetical protein
MCRRQNKADHRDAVARLLLAFVRPRSRFRWLTALPIDPTNDAIAGADETLRKWQLKFVVARVVMMVIPSISLATMVQCDKHMLAGDALQ